MIAARTLPARPLRTTSGDGLAVGTYEIVSTADGGFTVERRIAAEVWFPLTECGAVQKWPTRQSCADSCMRGDLFDFSDWPQWGTKA